MSKSASLAFIILLSFGFSPKSDSYISENLEIEKLTENTYLHTSFFPYKGSKVRCNGLVYVKNGEAFIIDSPTENVSSEELIDWLENEKDLKVVGVVGTHFHADCLGGLEVFMERKIPTYSTELTKELAVGEEMPQAEHTFKNKKHFMGKSLLLKYFGPGHTKDNIVAYIPSEKVLFGGCLIKEIGAGEGYTGDADLNEWSNTVKEIKKKLPEAEYIVPGHGKSGDVSLLDYTIELFDK
ncbi:subclass B1 metallo-beta-lactamase [uncultured Arcticibacterium sp.]|uniref:subclass B1 metallo-beta-lactamase n=1 Tax=uncultured Arcticibacterium sp. TaxID=2173042 RepID=UPI0030F5BEFF